MWLCKDFNTRYRSGGKGKNTGTLESMERGIFKKIFQIRIRTKKRLLDCVIM